MIEDQLELTRKNYLKSSTSGPNIGESWEQLQGRLGKQKHIYMGSYTRALVVVVILAAIIPLSVIQAAKPGQAFYPAKLLADDLVAKISGKIEYKIERRAQEVIDLSTGNSSNIKEATNKYQKTLEEAKQEAEKSGKQQEFDQALEQQQQQFQNAIEKNPSSQSHLEEAIKKTEEVKGQVKGAGREQPQNSQGQDNQNHQPANLPSDRGEDNPSESKVDK